MFIGSPPSKVVQDFATIQSNCQVTHCHGSSTSTYIRWCFRESLTALAWHPWQMAQRFAPWIHEEMKCNEIALNSFCHPDLQRTFVESQHKGPCVLQTDPLKSCALFVSRDFQWKEWKIWKCKQILKRKTWASHSVPFCVMTRLVCDLLTTTWLICLWISVLTISPAFVGTLITPFTMHLLVSPKQLSDPPVSWTYFPAKSIIGSYQILSVSLHKGSGC